MENKKEVKKVLVCIGSSPSSVKCIDRAAKMAKDFGTNLTAVYVESEEQYYLNENDKKILHSNIEYASSLGAEVVTLYGHDIAFSIGEYAKRTGITNIVIGKSRNKRNIFHFSKKSLENKLISLLPDAKIYLISDREISRAYRTDQHKKQELILYKQEFAGRDFLITFVSLLIAVIISVFLEFLHVENENMIMMFILAILIISRVTEGCIYGIISSLLSVFIFNCFFTKPYFRFLAIRKSDGIALIIMLVVSLTTYTLTARAKAQARFAAEREKRTEILYEINKKLLITTGIINIVHLTNEYIIKIFQRTVIFFIQDPYEGGKGIITEYKDGRSTETIVSDNEKSVVHWVFEEQKRAGAGTDIYPEAEFFYNPVVSGGVVLGVVGLSCEDNSYLDQNNRLFLRMINSLVAMALERQQLSDKQKIILIQSEKEKMRSNLLRAVSHDLRTPLTGILGASSTVLENYDTLDKATILGLLANIKEESQWLIRMVENLLSVTRINGGLSEVKKHPEAAEEIVASAIGRIRKRFKGCKINVKVPEELLIVPMDGTLIEQVIINLLENAIKHSGIDTEIYVDVKKEQDMAIFEVSDNGEGIGEDDLPYLFSDFLPSDKKISDSTGGMGIGLPICRSIIKAHNGKMEAGNKKNGGAVFRFILPLEGEVEDEKITDFIN